MGEAVTEYSSTSEAFEAGRQDGARECLETIKAAKAESAAEMAMRNLSEPKPDWQKGLAWFVIIFGALVAFAVLR